MVEVGMAVRKYYSNVFCAGKTTVYSNVFNELHCGTPTIRKNSYFFRKVGIFSPASDDAINMPSLLNRVSSFLALMTHQIESLL